MRKNSTITFGLVGLLMLGAFNAEATSSKSITCYKGTALKTVKGANPKCPTGYSTKKPTPAKSAAASAKSTSATNTSSSTSSINFSSTYKGTISMLWSASDVKVTNLKGTGTGSGIASSTLEGTGQASPSEQCNPIGGTGTITSSDGVISLKMNTDAQGCASDGEAPTVVTVSGSALITGGTGKYASASGTLKVSGTFGIKSTAAGSKESDDFNATLSGTITLKK